MTMMNIMIKISFRWCERKWPRGCFRWKDQKDINKKIEFKLSSQWQTGTCQGHI